MTLTQFIKTNQGKKVDFDSKYGAQCVDLYRAYCRDVLDIQQTPAVAGAKDIITKPGVLEVRKGFRPCGLFKGGRSCVGCDELEQIRARGNSCGRLQYEIFYSF